MRPRPALSDYPCLHGVLKSNPMANRQFNELLSRSKSHVGDNTQVESLYADVDSRDKQIQKLLAREIELSKIAMRLSKFVRVLGEVIEEQTDLTPYSSDVDNGKKYVIELTPSQVRTALILHWDTMAAKIESMLVPSVSDPADARVLEEE